MAVIRQLFLLLMTGIVSISSGEVCSIGHHREPGDMDQGPDRLVSYNQDPCACSWSYLGGLNVWKREQTVPSSTHVNGAIVSDVAREIQTFFECPEPCDSPLGMERGYIPDWSIIDAASGQKAPHARLDSSRRDCSLPLLTSRIRVDLGRPMKLSGIVLQLVGYDVMADFFSVNNNHLWQLYYSNKRDNFTLYTPLTLTGLSSSWSDLRTWPIEDNVTIVLNNTILARYFAVEPSSPWHGCYRFELLGCEELCQRPLGLSDGFIPDERIHISLSTVADFGPERARPIPPGVADYYGHPWCSGQQGSSQDVWIQVDLASATVVSGVRVQKMTDWPAPAAVYVWLREKDQDNWESDENNYYSVSGSSDEEYFDVLAIARYVRLILLESKPDSMMCLRFELLGCRDCRDHLGMANGSIPDSAIVPFTDFGNFRPDFVRLGHKHDDRADYKSWCADNSEVSPWIRVDLGRSLPVTGVITQGGSCCSYWVKSFRVKYTNDVDDVETDIGQVFTANRDQNTPVTNLFPRTVLAHYVSILPLTWHETACLRFEVLGCKDCNDSLGMQDGTIVDERITASSSRRSEGNPADEVRLGGPERDPNEHGVTMNTIAYSLTEPWVKVDLGLPSIVSGITLHCRSCTSAYNIKYTVEPSKWSHLTDENNQTMIFRPGSTARRIRFHHAIYARFVRVSPVYYIIRAGHPIDHHPQLELWGCRGRCEEKLGVEDGTISESGLTASSVLWHTVDPNEFIPLTGRLNSDQAWLPVHADTNQWLQVDLDSSTIVSGVITQGGRGNFNKNKFRQSWVETYRVRYSNDWMKALNDDVFRDVTDESGVVEVFPGNTDSDSSVTNLFREPILARVVRIVPVSWHNFISLRLELVGCRNFCQRRLGLENGEIPDRQISASSSWNKNTHGPQRARLNQRADPELGLAGGWLADVTRSADHWLQVDFVQWTNLTGVITQGRQDKNQWVTKYHVSYLQNDWLFVLTSVNGTTHEFLGNYDSEHLVTNSFLHQVIAKSVRVHPLSWRGAPAMRLELLGCAVTCQSQLGMEDGTIPDLSITSSLSASGTFEPHQARLGDEILSFHWLSVIADAEVWIQVDLGRRTRVSGIILQTDPRQNRYRTCWYNFQLKCATADRPTEWTPVKTGDKLELFSSPYQRVVFLGSEIPGERYNIFFDQSFSADLVRLYIMHQDASIVYGCSAVRFDLIGCLNGPREARTCKSLRADGHLLDGVYEIDVDGFGQGEPPFEAFCSMSTGRTTIHHDMDTAFNVEGTDWTKGMQFVRAPVLRNITYGISMEQIISVINDSSACEQSVKVKCFANDQDNGQYYQPNVQPFQWGSRTGELMTNWGVSTGTGGCKCGQTNDCSRAGKQCNCGSALNGTSWGSDEGLLTDKDTLPVTLVQAVAYGEEMHITVGPLVCK